MMRGIPVLPRIVSWSVEILSVPSPRVRVPDALIECVRPGSMQGRGHDDALAAELARELFDALDERAASALPSTHLVDDE
jgi:hypothetical protein